MWVESFREGRTALMLGQRVEGIMDRAVTDKLDKLVIGEVLKW